MHLSNEHTHTYIYSISIEIMDMKEHLSRSTLDDLSIHYVKDSLGGNTKKQQPLTLMASMHNKSISFYDIHSMHFRATNIKKPAHSYKYILSLLINTDLELTSGSFQRGGRGLFINSILPHALMMGSVAPCVDQVH